MSDTRIKYFLGLFFVMMLVNASGQGSAPRAQFFQSPLMNSYDIHYLRLDLNVEPNSRFISGNCYYEMSVVQPMDTFAIEFRDNMTLDSVLINGIATPFTRSGDHIYVAFSSPLPAGSALTARFYYSGIVVNGLAFGNDASIGFQYAGTLSESFQAREWFPAKQLLNYKIDSTDIWLTTTNPYMAGANGLLKQVISLPNNKTQYRWSSGYPMNYYLPCFAVGNYLEYRNYGKPQQLSGDSVLIQHLIANNTNYFNSVKPYLDMTPVFLDRLSQLIGVYPFYKEKYGHVQAYIGGGMEHQTMSTMQGFNFELVAHELAHQWFGDWVTCATWQDIWINEGFATYLENIMRQQFPTLASVSAQQQMLSRHTEIMNYPGGSVYINTPTYNEGRIFSGRLSYNKGAAVLHNLRFEMQSDSLFFTTLKTFLNRFKDSFATTNDFKIVAEQVCGRNFTNFFNQWIYGEGYPTFNVGYYKWGNDTLVLNVSQVASYPSVTPLFTGLMEYRITSTQGDTTILVDHTTATQTFRIPYNKTPTGVVVDPNNWVINKVGTVLSSTNVRLSAGWKGSSAWLTWSVSGNPPGAIYYVEKSTGGDFSGVGSVRYSAGGIYNFNDPNPESITYYRIRMVEASGAERLSDVVILKKPKALSDIRFIEASQQLVITPHFSTRNRLQIRLLTADGKIAASWTRAGCSEGEVIRMSLLRIPAGVYVVQMGDGEQSEVGRIIKQATTR